MAYTFTIAGEARVAILGPVRFWATTGLIGIEDARDNSYHTETVDEMLLRMRAGLDMLINSRVEKNNLYNYLAQVDELQNWLDDMDRVIRQAKEQGMPSDPTCRASIDAARKKTFIMPSVQF